MTASTAETCPACGAGAVKDGVCGRCGYAQGEANRCPHCQAVARIEKKGPGEWVCAVCGGPRTPGGLGGKPARTALAAEKEARGRATKQRAATWVWGVVATLVTLAVALAWPAALVAKVVALAFALAPALFAVRSASRVSGSAKEAAEAHERALLAAAQSLVAAKAEGVTAAELAERLELPEERADALLTQLAVHEKTRIDVGDDAEIRYSSAGAPARIATEGAEPLEQEDEDEARRMTTGRGQEHDR